VNGFTVVERRDAPSPGDARSLEAEICRLRVGGAYWGAQPSLPDEYILLTSASALPSALREFPGAATVLWASGGPVPVLEDIQALAGEFDPWHMLRNAEALYVADESDLSSIAAILEIPTFAPDSDGVFRLQRPDVALLLADMLGHMFIDPFSGDALSPFEAVNLCGFWRRLIDSNRDIAGAVGFAFWKQDNVAPLLWDGSNQVHFGDYVKGAEGRSVAIWRSKAPANVLASLESTETRLIEVEDGFLRSQGLGADCVPPLSITMDRLGAFFDPSRPSELESLLQDGEFSEDQIERARALRSLIVGAGLGKYESGKTLLPRRAGDRRHILVPGQVEDDRSVVAGGCGLVSNLELLRRVREQAPDAYILYKPHPDVVAGHRNGSVPDRACLEFADEVLIDTPISSLIDMVDEVHVNTSLAGFEALMREKEVTTYGVPFYAGWGLTRDLGPVPERRTARRTIDELVAAAVLTYPRYLDPVSGLPCPAEVVARRLIDGAAAQDGAVVAMRRIQGKVMRRLRELGR
jgi:capsular polysaccharide export protein